MTDTFNAWVDYCDKEKDSYLVWDGQRTNESLQWVIPGSSIMIAGHTNHGKTSLLMSMVAGLLSSNPDLMVIDFSIDDPCIKRYSQYTAILASLPINSVMNAKRVLVTPEEISSHTTAVATMTSWVNSDRLQVYEAMSFDGDNFKDQNRISFISETVIAARAKYPKRKIIFVVDALNDVMFDKGNVFSELDREESQVKSLQKLAIGTDTIWISSTHLRKNMGRRPSLEDLKGNSYLAYRATVVIGVYNDAKSVGIHNSKILWDEKMEDGTLVSRPVLEAWFLKSKVDDCRYPVIAYKQWPHKGRVQEFATKIVSRGYEHTPQDEMISLIYGEAK